MTQRIEMVVTGGPVQCGPTTVVVKYAGEEHTFTVDTTTCAKPADVVD
jgi:hypothetical protein